MDVTRKGAGVRRTVDVACGLVALLAAVSLFVFLLLANVEVAAYHINTYRKSFAATGAPARTGFTLDQLTQVISRVLDYSTGRRADLQFDRAELDSGPPGRPAFTPRELDHMVDVRRLFTRTRTVRWTALGMAAAGAAFLVFRERRRGLSRLARGIVFTAVISMAVWGGLAVVVVAGFDGFWTQFHLALFPNDLWRLPVDSLLIRMLPPELFQSLSLEVLGLFTAEVLALGALALVCLRRASRAGTSGSPRAVCW